MKKQKALLIYIGSELVYDYDTANLDSMQRINDLVNIKNFTDTLSEFDFDISKQIFTYFNKNDKWGYIENKKILLATFELLKKQVKANNYKAVIMVLSGHGGYGNSDGYEFRLNLGDGTKENNLFQKEIMDFLNAILCFKILIGNSCNLNVEGFVDNFIKKANAETSSIIRKKLYDIDGISFLNEIKSTDFLSLLKNSGDATASWHTNLNSTFDYEKKVITPPAGSPLQSIVQLANIPVAILTNRTAKANNEATIKPLLILGFDGFLYPTADNNATLFTNCLEMLTAFRFPINLEKFYFFVNSIINVNAVGIAQTQTSQSALGVGFVCYDNNYERDIDEILITPIASH